MHIGRREFLAGSAAAAAVLIGTPAFAAVHGERDMYGLIGKMITAPGQRDAVTAILMDAVGAMPGCLSYIIATDPADPNGIWITEVWDNKASHDGSLSLPAVQAAIAKARPMIAGFGQSTPTTPIGGFGLPSAPAR